MVYRPPKNKPAAPGPSPARPATDPFGSPLPKSGAAASVLPGDDRNLVTVDENYSGGDAEDRLWLFWQKHRNKVFYAVMVVSVAVILWQGWRIYQAHVATALQAEFSAASGPPALIAFSQAHPDTTLGKLAQLEAADTLYTDGKFKDAADAYAKAATLLGSDEKGQRARLGQALALLQSGDSKSASQMLETLAHDTSIVDNYRAESAYFLATLAAQAGDNAAVAKWIELVNQFKGSEWSKMAGVLNEILPLVGDVKMVSGGAITPPKLSPVAAPSLAPKGASAAAAASTAPATAAKPAASATPTTTTAAPKAASSTNPFQMPELAPVK